MALVRMKRKNSCRCAFWLLSRFLLAGASSLLLWLHTELIAAKCRTAGCKWLSGKWQLKPR